MTDTPTQTRPEPDARLERRILTLEEAAIKLGETMLQVAERVAGHLQDCPGATDEERRAASALADQLAGARS